MLCLLYQNVMVYLLGNVSAFNKINNLIQIGDTMNTLDIINNQLDDIEIARLDSQERMNKGEARRTILQDELSTMVWRWEQAEMRRLGIK